MTAEKVAKMDSSMNRILVVSLGLSVLACGADDVGDGGMDEVASTTDETETGTGTETSSDTGTTTETSTDTDTGTETDTTGSTDGPMPDMGTMPLDPNENIPPPDEEGCPAIYAQDLLPTFQLTIQPVVWDMLMWEWNNGESQDDMGLDPTPYHPLQEFRYDNGDEDPSNDIVIYDAEIRLRGNPINWDPLPGDKMQFQIDFNNIDPQGHFWGLKRLVFDAATFNRHMLRDRLALAVMRDAGIKAPCANNARLEINGEYYGLFTSIEKLDSEFLERNYEQPDGDLWKRANWEAKTNEETATKAHLDMLRFADTLQEVDANLDLMQALPVFAADAIIPNSDGPWAGGLNYYLYDNPETGKFELLPWDLDNTFERFDDPPDGIYPVNPDPVVFEKPNTWGRPWYDMALEDPEWFYYYIDSIDFILHEAYTVEEMHGRIDDYFAQTQEAALADPNKPYPNSTYLNKVQDLYDYVEQRYAWVDEWLLCWQMGGTPDAEGYCVP